MGLNHDLVRSAVESRMAELNIRTQDELADAAKVHVETLRDVLHGRRTVFKPVTLGRIARALGWPSDGIQRVSDGEDPIAWIAEDEELQRRLQAAVEDARMRKALGESRPTTSLEDRLNVIDERLEFLQEQQEEALSILRQLVDERPPGSVHPA